MFTYVMKTKIEELIDEKLNQEFPEEVEIRENQDYDIEEEVTLETEETDDDESETNNAKLITIWTLQIWRQIWKQQ